MPDTPRPAPKNSAGDPIRVAGSAGPSEGLRPPNSLPLELSSFVGRGREASEVEALLSEHRLLTLTGPGGSGKTRLALRVASRVLDGFEAGAWLVELAPLSDPDLVPQAVASALGAREAPGGQILEALAAHLRPKTALILLDNCEHLIGAGAGLAEALLRRCDWSYDLLTEGERTLIGRLSAFAGGFTLEAAEEVCSGGDIGKGGVLDLLASLVDKSLVLVSERDGGARYGLLETVRQYAAEKLEASGEAESVHRRHAEHYLALAEEAEPDLKEQGARLRRLEVERGNFGAALGWALRPGAPAEAARLGLGLAVALGYRRFWAVHGLGEGLGWLEKGHGRAGRRRSRAG